MVPVSVYPTTPRCIIFRLATSPASPQRAGPEGLSLTAVS